MGLTPMKKGTLKFKLAQKQKRAIRRRNRIAHLLADDKYHQRVVKKKKKEIKPDASEWRDDNGDFS